MSGPTIATIVLIVLIAITEFGLFLYYILRRWFQRQILQVNLQLISKVNIPLYQLWKKNNQYTYKKKMDKWVEFFMCQKNCQIPFVMISISHAHYLFDTFRVDFLPFLYGLYYIWLFYFLLLCTYVLPFKINWKQFLVINKETKSIKAYIHVVFCKTNVFALQISLFNTDCLINKNYKILWKNSF